VPQRILLFSALLVAMAGAALSHTTAARASGPEVGVSDDRVLLASGAKADKLVAEWQRNGVDTVRIFLLWNSVAPSPNSKKAPSGFDASNPDNGYNWYPYDLAVNRVRAAGMKVSLTMSGPGPLWASTKPGKRNHAYSPSPSAFGKFARAVGLHFGDRVDRYVLWNEPNSGAFLLPQTTGKGKKQVVASADIYRNLVRAGYPAVKKADPGAQVQIGALAPKGAHRTNVTTSPLTFMQRFGCVTDKFKKIRSGGCKHYKAPTGDAFAVHPYGAKTPPDSPPKGSADINLVTLSRVEKLLDRLHRMGRVKGPKHMGIYVDEYGYQTKPPDKTSGVSLKQQDQYMQRGAYLAWRDHRIKLLGQYLWYDEPKVHGSYRTWQSGVRFTNGKAKPSLKHFAVPFALDAAHNRLWGQVRMGSGRQRVTVQQKPKGAKRFKTLTRVRTDSRGYWALKRKLKSGTWYRFQVGKTTSSALRR
jgi:hypothetical protein